MWPGPLDEGCRGTGRGTDIVGIDAYHGTVTLIATHVNTHAVATGIASNIGGADTGAVTTGIDTGRTLQEAIVKVLGCGEERIVEQGILAVVGTGKGNVTLTCEATLDGAVVDRVKTHLDGVVVAKAAVAPDNAVDNPSIYRTIIGVSVDSGIIDAALNRIVHHIAAHHTDISVPKIDRTAVLDIVACNQAVFNITASHIQGIVARSRVGDDAASNEGVA